MTGAPAGPAGRCVLLRYQGTGGPQARVALLAVRAHEAADGIVPPPGAERPGADVGLAERCWASYREMQAAISHQAVGLLIRSPKTARSVMAIGPASGSTRTRPLASLG